MSEQAMICKYVVGSNMVLHDCEEATLLHCSTVCFLLVTGFDQRWSVISWPLVQVQAVQQVTSCMFFFIPGFVAKTHNPPLQDTHFNEWIELRGCCSALRAVKCYLSRTEQYHPSCKQFCVCGERKEVCIKEHQCILLF